jgi:hypothetical protein
MTFRHYDLTPCQTCRCFNSTANSSEKCSKGLSRIRGYLCNGYERME